MCCTELQCVAVCCSRIVLTTAAPNMCHVPHVLIYTCIGLFYMCIGLFYKCKSCDLDSNCSDLRRLGLCLRGREAEVGQKSVEFCAKEFCTHAKETSTHAKETYTNV